MTFLAGPKRTTGSQDDSYIMTVLASSEILLWMTPSEAPKVLHLPYACQKQEGERVPPGGASRVPQPPPPPPLHYTSRPLPRAPPSCHDAAACNPPAPLSTRGGVHRAALTPLPPLMGGWQPTALSPQPPWSKCLPTPRNYREEKSTGTGFTAVGAHGRSQHTTMKTGARTTPRCMQAAAAGTENTGSRTVPRSRGEPVMPSSRRRSRGRASCRRARG